MLPDPNVGLRLILALAEDICETAERGDGVDPDAGRLAELILGLDHWIAGGGALPDRWKPKESPFNRSPSTN